MVPGWNDFQMFERSDRCSSTLNRDHCVQGQQFVQCSAQAENVAVMVDLFRARSLFRTHVSRCSKQIARAREIHIRDKASQSKIGDIQPTFTIQEQIGRLDVPMNHSPLVRKCQGLGRARHTAARSGG
jgi:hypothetical protein